jgi:hypothetical protein
MYALTGAAVFGVLLMVYCVGVFNLVRFSLTSAAAYAICRMYARHARATADRAAISPPSAIANADSSADRPTKLGGANPKPAAVSLDSDEDPLPWLRAHKVPEASESAEERYLRHHNAEVARRDSELKAELERQGYVAAAATRGLR